MGSFISRFILEKKLVSDLLFCDSYNYIKDCAVGSVINIHYFVVFGKKKKAFFFTGILLSKRKYSFEVENCLDSEVINISFSYFSPTLVSIYKSDKYNFMFKNCRLSLKKKLSLIAQNVDFSSDFSAVYFDMPRFILNNFFGLLRINSFLKRKFKKIKKKFRY